METKDFQRIKIAIDATFNFEELMDSIDFNSYLEDDEKEILNETPEYPLYEFYRKEIGEASDCYTKVLDGKINKKHEIISEDIKNKYKKEEHLFNLSHFDLSCADYQKLIQWLIFMLFKAKEARLEARKQSRKEEEKKYIKAIHGLHKAFDEIPRKYFDSQKDKRLIDHFNWAKVLYFNELAICYSGLPKSSMSLGYAEQSISLLEELYPKLKTIENRLPNKLKKEIDKTEKSLTFSQIIKLN